MGLLEQEISELRELNKQLIAGKVDPKTVHARIAIYSETEKRAKMILQAFAIVAKHSNVSQLHIEATGLMGKTVELSTDEEPEVVCAKIADPTLRNVKCPHKDKTIHRSECNAFSRAQENYDTCTECAQYEITRRILDEHNASIE